MSVKSESKEIKLALKLINTIHFETMLLESLEWDELKLAETQEKLSKYFQVCSKKDLDLVKVDLEHIFNETISDAVYTYLSELTPGE